jgi:hypothetical protein
MKIRIRGNSIRFRLTQSEVKKISETGLVEERTEFPNGQNLIFSLIAVEKSDKVSAECLGGKISVFISKNMAKNWADSEQIGIYETFENLQIIVEKDFTCLIPRLGDEDTDTFSHPKESHNS